MSDQEEVIIIAVEQEPEQEAVALHKALQQEPTLALVQAQQQEQPAQLERQPFHKTLLDIINQDRGLPASRVRDLRNVLAKKGLSHTVDCDAATELSKRAMVVYARKKDRAKLASSRARAALKQQLAQQCAALAVQTTPAELPTEPTELLPAELPAELPAPVEPAAEIPTPAEVKPKTPVFRKISKTKAPVQAPVKAPKALVQAAALNIKTKKPLCSLFA